MSIPKRILHATDFSEQADAAFDLAWSLARALGARLIVLHVTTPPVVVDCGGLATPGGEPGRPAELWSELRRRGVPDAQGAIDHQLAVVTADPAAEIVRRAEELGCDLIVMGTHGRRGLHRVLHGSVAEEVARRAACPVLTVKNAPRPPRPPHVAEGAQAMAGGARPDPERRSHHERTGAV